MLAPLLILLAGLWAYHNSFAGVFLCDDTSWIVQNVQIRTLWLPLTLVGGSGRPLTDFSFALNYALGGLDVRGYHLINLTIHLLAALALFGLIRRTLLTGPLQSRYPSTRATASGRGLAQHIRLRSVLSPERSRRTQDSAPRASVEVPRPLPVGLHGRAADGLALTAALLWAVHPLQTQSVTYVIQRAESLMGLWYLLTLYSLLRGASASSPRRWYAACVMACAMGMASKPVMVTAPVMALLYDRVFLAGSFRRAWRQRRRLYLGLAATWGFLAVLLATRLTLPEPVVGFAVKGITPFSYSLTQLGVIAHYLRLACWPHPLVFDYDDWPIATTVQAILPAVLVIGTLGLATLWAWRHRPALGFLGAWFFVILAPTSSVIPLADRAFEHRMYLPLAAVICLVVLVGYEGLRRFSQARLRQGLATGLVVALVIALGGLTVRRNADYHDELAFWLDNLSKRPQNARVHCALGDAFSGQGKWGEAIGYYTEALRLKPDYETVHNNLGNVFVQEGRTEEGIAHLREALRLQPADAAAHNNLAIALAAHGEVAEAIKHLTEALRLDPDYAQAHSNLGNLLALQGQFDEALAHYREALRLEPGYTVASRNVARLLAHSDTQ